MLMCLAEDGLGQQILHKQLQGHMSYSSISALISYQNSNIGIRMDTPLNWKKIDHPNGNAVAFFAPPVYGQSGVPTGISIGALPSQNDNITKYVSDTIKDYEESLPGFRLIGSNPSFTLGGNPAYAIFFSNRDTDSGSTVYTMQIFTIKNDRIYSIIYQGSGQDYIDNFPTMYKIIGSLRFIDTSTKAQ